MSATAEDSPDSEDKPRAWMPDPLALDAAAIVYDQVLSQIDIMGLNIGIPHGDGVAMHEGEGYADALIDLSRLLEEYRFEAAIAAMYAAGVKQQLAAVRNVMAHPPHNAGFSNKARAILAGIISQGAPPFHLMTKPESEMSGMRVLGGWWAAQLYDSALMRGVAVLDRLVTLMFYVEGLPVDPDWTPAFRERTIRKLTSWTAEPEWSAFTALLHHELFITAKGYRDGLVHRVRDAAELHGDFLVGRFRSGGHEQTAGFGGDVHFALVANFYNEVLRQAVSNTSALISGTMEARGARRPPGAEGHG